MRRKHQSVLGVNINCVLPGTVAGELVPSERRGGRHLGQIGEPMQCPHPVHYRKGAAAAVGSRELGQAMEQSMHPVGGEAYFHFAAAMAGAPWGAGWAAPAAGLGYTGTRGGVNAGLPCGAAAVHYQFGAGYEGGFVGCQVEDCVGYFLRAGRASPGQADWLAPERGYGF